MESDRKVEFDFNTLAFFILLIALILIDVFRPGSLPGWIIFLVYITISAYLLLTIFVILLSFIVLFAKLFEV
ncbi:hypothetical protein DRJ17_04535 [Candidatus Woesearchaeota archaeon]|nr:MAG: hypothetical protein DRJ17_04535 [Candidatus Woesearchaeota archaeon]